MLKPNFLIIGAQKSGSTWLWKLLRQHPSIYMAEKKELEFFSYCKNKKMVSKYLQDNFGCVDPYIHKVVGEATPSYFWNTSRYEDYDSRPIGFSRDIPERVKEELGLDTKLLVSLRNPVERTISAYIHHINKERVPIDVGILEQGKQRGIIHMSFYAAHLMEWLAVFPLAQIKVMVYESMMEKPIKSLRDIFDFLGVNSGFIPLRPRKFVHKGLQRFMIDGEIYVPLREHWGEIVNPDDLDKLKKVVSSEEISELRRLFTKDMIELEAILKYQIMEWH